MTLVNVLNDLRFAKDLIVNEGPDALRKVADVMSKIETATRQAADLLQQVGPTLVFATHENASCVEQLKTLKDACDLESQCSTPRCQPTVAARPGTPPVTQISPALRNLLLTAIASIITEILKRLGANADPVSPTTPSPSPSDFASE